MKIVVGLGNPGKEYSHNRHNIGFRCIDCLASRHSIQLNQRACQSDVGQFLIDDTKVILAKPRTFVNLSGKAVAPLLDKYKCNPSDLIVIYDDLDLATGKLRLRMGGSAGGHRGVKSIIASIGTQDFDRVRIGISRPFSDSGHHNEDDIVNYVLGNFPKGDLETIEAAISTAAEAIECIISEGMEMAMNKFNKNK